MDLVYNFKIEPVKTKREGFNGYGKKRTGHFVNYGTYSKWVGVSGIYWIKNKKSNLIYIGSTTNIGTRLAKHFSQLRTAKHPNTLLLADYNKYGQESFEFGVFEVTNENLFDKEAEYQKQYKLSELYNQMIKGLYNSPAQRLAWKSENKDNHKTKEYREKMKAIKSNRIGMFDKQTHKLLETFINSDEVCNKYNIAKSTLLGCCNGSKKTGIGYIWHYLDENNNILLQGKGKQRDKIRIEEIV